VCSRDAKAYYKPICIIRARRRQRDTTIPIILYKNSYGLCGRRWSGNKSSERNQSLSRFSFSSADREQKEKKNTLIHRKHGKPKIALALRSFRLYYTYFFKEKRTAIADRNTHVFFRLFLRRAKMKYYISSSRVRALTKIDQHRRNECCTQRSRV